MAIPPYDSAPLMDRMQAIRERVELYEACIKAVVAKGSIHEIPETFWGEREFRLFLLGVFRARERLQQDSADLATIARVFGGSAR